MPRREYTINHDAFGLIRTEAQAYWLGFLAADGSIDPERGSIRVELQARDRGHLDKLAVFLGSDIEPRQVGGRDTWHLTVYSKEMAGWLATLGLAAGKVSTFSPPALIPSVRRHFWRGMMDGDGSIFRRPPLKSGGASWGVNLTGTEATVNAFAEWCEMATGRRPSVRRARERVIGSGHVCVAAALGSHKPLAIIRELYTGAGVFLTRKMNRAAEAMQTEPTNADLHPIR
jgi:hypothetical protein